ncbi:MAG: M15 family metallopeptidase [Spirosomataceae bacterium]
MQKIVVSLVVGIVMLCPVEGQATEPTTSSNPLSTFPFPLFPPQDCPEEKKMEAAGLVDIQKLDPSILVDLKYSGTDNFVKQDVYGCITRCFLQPLAAQKLIKASQYLQKKHPNLRLLVYDGARSREVQWKFWKALSHIPPNQREDYVSNPQIGSIHNYGCAVDLTVATADGKPLDMGTIFDFFGELAYPRYESKLLKDGKLSKAQIENRKILREAMRKGGFSPIETEWWHFNAISRKRAKATFGIIE